MNTHTNTHSFNWRASVTQKC